MNRPLNIAFIFPGQGVQHVGMGKDFIEQFARAKETVEEANDRLGRDLQSIFTHGPVELLTETHNSQTAIYVVSIAILRVICEQFPDLKPTMTGGLSLGEYSALTAGGFLPFDRCLPVVQKRGLLMSEACRETKGAMAVVLGMSAEAVEQMVSEINLPKDLWAANFNCPGQVVISGTEAGIQKGIEEAKKRGAKRVLPLQVHGAFHSGLMRHAQSGLSDWILNSPIEYNKIAFFMNVTGKAAESAEEIKSNLIAQVTAPVRWEHSIRAMNERGVDLYVEIGPGETLAGFNKRIGGTAPTVSVRTVADLEELENQLNKPEMKR